jgi:protein required for attachment to host cells
MQEDRKLWVVIADGERARFLGVTPRGVFHTHHVLESPSAHKRSAELGTSRPVRSCESATGTRHTITRKHDLHDMEKRRFAERVAHEIERCGAEGAFDRLVLVAPAHTMREIRGRLDATTSAKIVGKLQKDLTKVPDHELGTHLEEWAIGA